MVEVFVVETADRLEGHLLDAQVIQQLLVHLLHLLELHQFCLQAVNHVVFAVSGLLQVAQFLPDFGMHPNVLAHGVHETLFLQVQLSVLLLQLHQVLVGHTRDFREEGLPRGGSTRLGDHETLGGQHSTLGVGELGVGVAGH